MGAGRCGRWHLVNVAMMHALAVCGTLKIMRELAALLAVVASFMFPVTLQLTGTPEIMSAPEGLGEVMKNILLKIVDNPVNAIADANYIGILAWAVAFGLV